MRVRWPDEAPPFYVITASGVNSIMERLANTFGETVSLFYLYDDGIHVLECIETSHDIRMPNNAGRVRPHCGAMGKVITTFQGRALADRILEVYRLTPHTGEHHHRSS